MGGGGGGGIETDDGRGQEVVSRGGLQASHLAYPFIIGLTRRRYPP